MSFRRFYLNRIKDISGMSGTGRVAEGAMFRNGKVCLCWQTDSSRTAVYENMKDVEHLHGHEGATEIVWIDKDEKKFEFVLPKLNRKRI